MSAKPPTPTPKPRNDLDYVDKYVKRADAECRASMLSIIAKCPEVVKTMTEEELQWVSKDCAHV